MFGFRRVFATVDLWEAAIAKAFAKRLPIVDASEKSRTKKVGVRLTIFFTGIGYNIFAIIFKIIVITLFCIFRFVVPLMYLFFVIAFGMSSSATLYNSVAGNVSMLNSEWTPEVIVKSIPIIALILFLLTLYCVGVFVVGRAYYRVFLNRESP